MTRDEALGVIYGMLDETRHELDRLEMSPHIKALSPKTLLRLRRAADALDIAVDDMHAAEDAGRGTHDPAA